jgi:hypothetical protein
VREQFFLAAVAQNIKRLMRFLSQPTRPGSASHHLVRQEEKLDSRNDRSQKIFRSRTFSTATPGLDNGGGVIQGESKLYQIRVSAEKAKSLMA